MISRQAVPRQIAESGQNVALVAPQLALDAADSSAGNFWKPGHFATYIDEAAERLMRLYGDRRAGAHFNQAPVVVVAYSGGYLSAAYALRTRRRRPSHQGRDPDGCALRRRGQVRGLGRGAPPPGVPAERLHRIRRRTRTRRCESLLDKRRVPYTKGLPPALSPERSPSRRAAARHAWRFCYTRLAARSPETCAGDDSRLPARFVLNRAHERSPAPGTSGHLRRPRHAPLRLERDQPAAACAAGGDAGRSRRRAARHRAGLAAARCRPHDPSAGRGSGRARRR